MVMQLVAQQQKQFLCPGEVKKFVVPVPWERQELPQIVQRYMECQWRNDDMSLLEFLRKAGADGQISQKYRRKHRLRFRRLNVPIELERWMNRYQADGQVLVAAITYTRSSDRHCGQWLLLNVPFRNVDDLWHPDAARLPQSLRCLGLCLLHRPDFWRNDACLTAEMTAEARTDLYIKNQLSMLRAKIELVDAYLSGELSVERHPDPPLHGVASTPSGPLQLAPEQALIIQTISERVEYALQARWGAEEDDAEAWGVWLDEQQYAPYQNQVSVVLGPAGSGKSTAVEQAVMRATRLGAHVGIACPTGMLATHYKTRHPDLDVDTVHGMFALHWQEAQTLDIMKKYDMIVIDEVGQLPQWVFERLLRLWDAADRRPALVFVGDFCQLTGVDGTTARQSPRWAKMRIMQLRDMKRCKCPRLRWKLELLRSATPSKQQLRKILRHHRAPTHRRPHAGAPTSNDIAKVLRETPRTTFLTITRQASKRLNECAVQVLFEHSQPLRRIPGDPDENPDNFWGQHQVAAEEYHMTIYEGMRVRITRNEDKERGFVNGMGATVQCMRRSGVQVITDAGRILLVHPVTHEIILSDGSIRRMTFFPLRLGYSTTLHKVQGATLSHITLWLDRPGVRAALYVALSRVQYDEDWRFIGDIGIWHCLPARLS